MNAKLLLRSTKQKPVLNPDTTSHVPGALVLTADRGLFASLNAVASVLTLRSAVNYVAVFKDGVHRTHV